MHNCSTNTDSACRLLSALMRFSMGIRLSQSVLDRMSSLERNCARHVSVVNDIYSYEKELKTSQIGHKEGSHLCSAVKIIAGETSLGIPATKRVLWSMVREWEKEHEDLVTAQLSVPPGFTEVERLYMKGLEYQMSGNELWSKTTPRYM